jgi:predicted MFS family arabinose efflux permease
MKRRFRKVRKLKEGFSSALVGLLLLILGIGNLIIVTWSSVIINQYSYGLFMDLTYLITTILSLLALVTGISLIYSNINEIYEVYFEEVK